jgi:hypothetical protein
MVLVMAVLLGSPWAGGLATTAGDSAAAQLTAGRLLLSLEPAVRDRLPALRPSAERPSSAGRPGSLLGLLVAALAAAFARRARHHASGPAGTRSLGLGSRRDARAPPLLQPA